VATATLDGAPVDWSAIPLINDSRTHEVQIVLGDHQQQRLVQSEMIYEKARNR
jgi:hypothetical protein